MKHHHGSGRPGQALDTAAWNATGARVADTNTFPARVTVGPAAAAPRWNPDTRQTETTARDAVYVEGPADIAADAPAEPVDAAGEQVPARTYTVRLSATHAGADDVTAGHVVTVVGDPDPALVGQRLHVESVRAGSRGFSRHLTCTRTT